MPTPLFNFRRNRSYRHERGNILNTGHVLSGYFFPFFLLARVLDSSRSSVGIVSEIESTVRKEAIVTTYLFRSHFHLTGRLHFLRECSCYWLQLRAVVLVFIV
jgi:hypothetical protein